MADQRDPRDLLLEKALHRIEALEAELAAATAGAGEPIAIVGIGCRFPGADGPQAYWRLLVEGRDAISEVPADRWDAGAFYDPDPEAPGKMVTRQGGFVDGLAELDAPFFGLSPRETASVDPQQRLLLEVAWEAFEHAGLPPRGLPAATGVYVGVSNVDYREALVGRGAAEIDDYFASGTTTSTASGRLSYFFGLTGPCLSLDTACSSSALAVHLAAAALRRGECGLALAGGVNRIVTPHESISLSKARMLSPDGRCKSFDASADGYGRAEGCGLVVLERLSDAVAAGHAVYAVLRGSATNQDGFRSGLTVPHGPSEQAVIRAALDEAGVAPDEVAFVEAQGTGTTLGDQIELAALGAVFGERRSPLLVGTAKSNLGHLESAAGVAGLIKAVLALHHGEIPPSLHFREPNPAIDWQALPIRVPTAAEPWPDGRRLAGVSSFGFSGTNVHLVLESAPGEPAARGAAEALPEQDERPVHLLALSARSRSALDDLAGRYVAYLEAEEAAGREVPIADLCFTANAGRSHFGHRLGLVAASTAELGEALAAWRAGRETAVGTVVVGGRAGRRGRPKVALLFNGDGGRQSATAHSLMPAEPRLRRALARCREILEPLLDRPPDDLLEADLGEAGDDSWALTVSVEWALAELWRSWGVEADFALGSGAGELAAACVAGAFALEDALALAVERDRWAAAAGDRTRVEASSETVARIAARAGRGRVPLVSGNSGGLVDGAALGSADHWLRPVGEPSRRAAAMAVLAAEGAEVYLEIGPGSEGQSEEDSGAGGQGAAGQWRELLTRLARLYARGAEIDWLGFEGDRGRTRRRLSLPTYPFERRSYWLAPQPVLAPAPAGEAPAAARDDEAPRPAAARPAVPASARASREKPAVAEVAKGLAGADLRQRLAAATDKRRLLAGEVEALLREILGSREPIDPGEGFADLGMDSLRAMELRRRLQRAVGRPLPPTVAFKYPTLDELVAFLAQVLELEVGADRSATTSSLSDESVGDGAEPISAEELMARISGKARSHGR